MKRRASFIAILFVTGCVCSIPSIAQTPDLLHQTWLHGSVTCAENHDPGIQVVRFDPATFILRQNKCLNYEAPFLYLFIGKERALLVDTGAEAKEDKFPLFNVVDSILKSNAVAQLPLLVIHSHAHDDHYAGDHQFLNKAGVQLIAPTKEALIAFLGFTHWPLDKRVISLGGRDVIVIPIPGHDLASIAIYDPLTQWLLTGDTVYPGRLYVRDGSAFTASIARLHEFSKTNPISLLMGNHIEMSTDAGIDYPVGTTYQPREHVLPLPPSTLGELRQACEKRGGKLVYEVHNDFIIVPKN